MCVAVVVVGVVDQDQNQDQVMDLSIAFCSSLMRPRIVFYDRGKFFSTFATASACGQPYFPPGIAIYEGDKRTGPEFTADKNSPLLTQYFFRLPCQGCIYERQYWNYYSGNS